MPCRYGVCEAESQNSIHQPAKQHTNTHSDAKMSTRYIYTNNYNATPKLMWLEFSIQPSATKPAHD